MARLVQLKPRVEASRDGPQFAAGESSSETIKEYGERVAKYVPVEVLAFYGGAVQLVLTKQGPEHAGFRAIAFAAIGIAALVATPLYLGIHSANRKERRANQVVATAALLVWIYAYPAGWFAERGLHEPVIAGLTLLGFTLASGLYQPRE